MVQATLAGDHTLTVPCFMSSPDPIDVQVGARLRVLRRSRGLTQTDLATELGLTFQQVQKYERGANRISASKLWHAAQLLGVPVHELFGEASAAANGGALDGMLAAPGTADLLGAWQTVPTLQQRRAVIELVRALGQTTGQASRKGRSK